MVKSYWNCSYGFPQLEQFNFQVYEWHQNCEYEIYPKNNVYTPFQALKDGNIDNIIARNVKYGASYNFGEYPVAKVQERLSSQEVRNYFFVIRNLPRNFSTNAARVRMDLIQFCRRSKTFIQRNMKFFMFLF